MNTYTCPVCGYDQLEDPPANHEICPCCYTQFAYSDDQCTHDQLRAYWIIDGAPWRDDPIPPAGWNPVEQLRNIGYEVTENDLRLIRQARSNASAIARYV